MTLVLVVPQTALWRASKFALNFTGGIRLVVSHLQKTSMLQLTLPLPPRGQWHTTRGFEHPYSAGQQDTMASAVGCYETRSGGCLVPIMNQQ